MGRSLRNTFVGQMTNQVCPDVRYWPLADMHEWPLRNEARALVEPQFLRQVYGRDGSGDE